MTTELKEPAANELVFTRVFDAPRELVFEAWTNPQHVVKWWGPNGFTTTTKSMDVEVGGLWDYVMHGPDGTDYPGKSIYSEVVKPERLVYSNVGGKADDPHLTCQMTVTFEETDGKTVLTLRMLFPSVAAAGHAREFGAEAGGHESLARLADFLVEAAN